MIYTQEKIEHTPTDKNQNVIENQLLMEKLIKENKLLKNKQQEAESTKWLFNSFIKSISHEVRTPLNAILGFSKLITKKNLTQSEREGFSKMIHDSGFHLLHILDNLLLFSVLQNKTYKVNKETVKLKKLLESLSSILKDHTCNSSLQLKTDLGELDCSTTICTDLFLISKIFENLIENAFKFTKQGKITCTAQVKSKLTHNELCFMLEDSGEGIPEKYKNQVFTPFFQIPYEENNIYPRGNGIGLTIVHLAINLLQGSVQFKSEVKSGTTFCIKIPL